MWNFLLANILLVPPPEYLHPDQLLITASYTNASDMHNAHACKHWRCVSTDILGADLRHACISNILAMPQNESQKSAQKEISIDLQIFDNNKDKGKVHLTNN